MKLGVVPATRAKQLFCNALTSILRGEGRKEGEGRRKGEREEKGARGAMQAETANRRNGMNRCTFHSGTRYHQRVYVKNSARNATRGHHIKRKARSKQISHPKCRK
jgi:hypothetical protein